MRAGVGRAVITPPIGIEHAGWGAQVHHRAEGVHLDLWVTVLVVEGETETFAILDYDLMIVTVEDSDRIRGDVAAVLGIDPCNVRVSFTHTHAGPVWSDFLGSRSGRAGAELVPGYRETIWSQTLGATHQAKAALRPARLAAGWGESDIAVNRRLRAPTGELVVGQNPAGFADHRVLVVRFDDLDENPLAALVCYAAHPIILAYQNRLLSPDFPGVAKRVVEELTGAACLYLQGCAGNTMTVEALTADLGAAERMGTMLGAEAAKVFTGIRTRPTRRRFEGIVESGAPLGIWVDEPLPDREPLIKVIERGIEMPLRPTEDPGRADDHAQSLSRAFLELERSGAPQDQVAEARFRARRAMISAAWAKLGQGRTHLPTTLHGIRMDSVALVGFTGEPFAETGTRVREDSPLEYTHMAGYSNGVTGYVPTAEEFERGGYEPEWGTAFTSEAASVLEREALMLLADLADHGGNG
ncbi:MAG: neutral/alkaline non-lysosomal ceramidase N-terminal domain-containing protein [Actinomycetia bacterium]|nr:neutral/alkaline non-lysosomal ceramidase N-terminal domain-containing protein [Actinomycetes bacterium]